MHFDFPNEVEVKKVDVLMRYSFGMQGGSPLSKRTGKCLCERVGYEIEGQLGPIFNCHFSKCHRSIEYRNCVKNVFIIRI